MSPGATETVDDPGGLDDRARWDARYRGREAADRSGPGPRAPGPPTSLVRMVSLLPDRGRAIDLAGGDGGGGLFLTGRGLEVVVVDVSPVALGRADAFASARGADLTTAAVDLGGARLGSVLASVGPPAPVVVTCFNFLDRDLLASVADDLPSGCRFLAAVATTINLERHRRPPERFLLRPGELARTVLGPDPTRLRVLHRREGWADDRHRAELAVEAR